MTLSLFRRAAHGAGAIAALVAATASPAAATDAKIYPGVMCKYYGTQAADAFFDPAGQQANGLKNTSSATRYAVCPIVRDITSNDLESVQAFVEKNVSCTLYVRSWAGSSVQTYGPDDPWVPFGSEGRHLTWFGGSGNGAAADVASMALYCSVPPGGIIYNYRVDEAE